MINGSPEKFFLHNRWAWHVLFWLIYIVFRFWPYYITINYDYPPAFIEYMLLSEMLFVGGVYFTIWLYKKVFDRKRFGFYFAVGTFVWVVYLLVRTLFQFWWLKEEPAFRNNSFTDIFFNNIAMVIVYFLFITTCKYFKDGYIRQHFEAEKREQQLLAEVNNLKSQIAPHFLFNTLNNLYGLAAEKSDKLPELMLRLSNLLRHSLYETQKPLVPVNDEIRVITSYIELESIRLEKDLQLDFDNSLPPVNSYQIAPLLLIVFVENAFKHSRLVIPGPVMIYIQTKLEGNIFSFTVSNNYNKDVSTTQDGIGLANVKRRLQVLYPNHELSISQDAEFFNIILKLQLQKSNGNGERDPEI